MVPGFIWIKGEVEVKGTIKYGVNHYKGEWRVSLVFGSSVGNESVLQQNGVQRTIKGEKK